MRPDFDLTSSTRFNSLNKAALSPLCQMFVAVLSLELSVFDAYSLKEKRTVVNSLLDKVRGRFNVSAAQIDNHDLWNRATLAFAVVSNSRITVERVLNHVRDLAEEDETRCEVIQCQLTWL